MATVSYASRLGSVGKRIDSARGASSLEAVWEALVDLRGCLADVENEFAPEDAETAERARWAEFIRAHPELGEKASLTPDEAFAQHDYYLAFNLLFDEFLGAEENKGDVDLVAVLVAGVGAAIDNEIIDPAIEQLRVLAILKAAVTLILARRYPEEFEEALATHWPESDDSEEAG